MKLNGTTIPDEVVQRVLARRGNLHCFADLDPTRTALVVIDLQNAFMLDGVGHAVVPSARHRPRGQPPGRSGEENRRRGVLDQEHP
jgi:ureidoacrylate peracid hydrolase